MYQGTQPVPNNSQCILMLLSSTPDAPSQKFVEDNTWLQGNTQFLFECWTGLSHPLCSSRKYLYSPHRRFLFCTPLPPGNSGLFSYIASKYLAFKTPLPLGISIDLPWGGQRFFLELYTLSNRSHTLFWLSQSHLLLMDTKGTGQSLYYSLR